MTFAKTFGQRHVLRFLSSHIDLSGCRITAASPVGLRVTDGVHKLCLKSTDGCIQREDDPNSVAPEPIEPYEQTERRSAQVIYGELSRMPRKLTLQQAAELPESLLRHFLSHPQLSDVDVRRLVDTIMYEQTNTMMETKTSFQIPQLLDGDNFTSEDLADDMEGLRLSFTRIKIPGGGHLQFEIPSGNPDVPDYLPASGAAAAKP